MRKPSLVVIALIVTAVVHGQTALLWQPPTIWAGFGADKPAGALDLIPKITIGSFPVVFGDTPLKEVGARFGASIGHAGDASESLDWVCLHGQDRSGPWILWIESSEIDGPMAGGFLLMRRTANDRLDSRCRPVEDGRISLPMPLRLGMSRAQMMAALGPPASQSGKRLLYYHHRVEMRSPKAGTAPEPFDLVNTLYIRLNSSDIVDAIAAWRTKSS